jgi:ABC-type sugar transport system substrate-binding protein
MKRFFAIALALLLLITLFGCTKTENGNESPDTSPTDQTPTDTSTTDEPKTIVYLCNSLTVQWSQDVADALESFADEYNFKLTAQDSGNNNEKAIQLLETFSAQKVDGFIFMLSRDIGERVNEIALQSGIPYLFESIALVDSNGKIQTSGVELNGYDCGAQCSIWISENYETYLGDVTDWSEAGFISVTFSSVPNLAERNVGAQEAIREYLPECTNIFEADLVSQGTGNAETAYSEVAAVINSNPQVKKWMIVAVQDAYGQGAARAVEGAGFDKQSVVVSVGGENLLKEWDAGYEGCWAACNYFEAYNYAEQLIPGLFSIIDGETTAEELWPEWKVEGTNFSSMRITGKMATKDTYKDVAVFKK